MRLFAAAMIDERIRRRCVQILQRLSETGADYKWVAPGNLHLTLVFLGDVEEKSLGRAKDALSLACARGEPFPIRYSKVGSFMQEGSPAVVWLGIGEGREAMGRLAIDLRKGLEEAGFPDREQGRDFRAHLTLGRRRSSRGMENLLWEFGQLNAELGRETLRQEIDRVWLFESRLRREGPEYAALADWRLGAR